MPLRRYTTTIALSLVAAIAATLGVYGMLNAPNARRKTMGRGHCCPAAYVSGRAAGLSMTSRYVIAIPFL
jgi:hypothetical protein